MLKFVALLAPMLPLQAEEAGDEHQCIGCEHAALCTRLYTEYDAKAGQEFVSYLPCILQSESVATTCRRSASAVTADTPVGGNIYNRSPTEVYLKSRNYLLAPA